MVVVVVVVVVVEGVRGGCVMMKGAMLTRMSLGHVNGASTKRDCSLAVVNAPLGCRKNALWRPAARARRIRLGWLPCNTATMIWHPQHNEQQRVRIDR